MAGRGFRFGARAIVWYNFIDVEENNTMHFPIVCRQHADVADFFCKRTDAGRSGSN